jgi:hypothetical protein
MTTIHDCGSCVARRGELAAVAILAIGHMHPRACIKRSWVSTGMCRCLPLTFMLNVGKEREASATAAIFDSRSLRSSRPLHGDLRYRGRRSAQAISLFRAPLRSQSCSVPHSSHPLPYQAHPTLLGCLRESTHKPSSECPPKPSTFGNAWDRSVCI